MDSFASFILLNYQLIRSHRRTLALEISADASLIVRAPKRLSEKKINLFVLEKEKWITQKIKEVKQQLEDKKSFEFKENEMHTFLNEQYPIKIIEKQKIPLLFFQNSFYLSDLEQNPQEAFEKLYIAQAKDWISKRVSHFATAHNLEFKNIKINKAKTRWGSCSHINNLNFNYRLILAPEYVLDYVVIHELAHTVHKNHSSNFWDFVEIMMPEYKKEKNWLKKNGSALINTW